MLLPVAPLDQVTVPLQFVADSVEFRPEVVLVGLAEILGAAGLVQPAIAVQGWTIKLGIK